MIEDRNLGPLAVAFVTILAGWMLVFGLVFASTQFFAQPHNVAQGSEPPAVATTVR
jgi:uncharacterized membrane protein YphA (DoxX/SURF4 family)